MTNRITTNASTGCVNFLTLVGMGAGCGAGQSPALVSSVKGVRAAQSQEANLRDTWLGVLTPTVPSDSVSPSVPPPNIPFSHFRIGIEFPTGHTLAPAADFISQTLLLPGVATKPKFWPMRYEQKGRVQHLAGASKRKEGPDVTAGAAASIWDPLRLYVEEGRAKRLKPPACPSPLMELPYQLCSIYLDFYLRDKGNFLV